MSLKSRNPDLSIVIPALNEEKRIGKTLDELKNFLKTNPSLSKLECEVLVVSANSTDKTHEKAKEHGRHIDNFRLLLPGQKVGKGRDVKYGMLQAKGRCVIFMDADLATPLHHLYPLYDAIVNGNSDLAIGVRNLKLMHRTRRRRLISQCGNLLFRIISGIKITDTQCGFKAFSQYATKICFNRQTIMGWGFDMELLTIAHLNGLMMYQQSISDWKNGDDSTLMNPFRSAIMTLGDLFKITVNRVGKVYTS